jgi:hypothetical protein
MQFFISPKPYLKEARFNKERVSSFLEIENDLWFGCRRVWAFDVVSGRCSSIKAQ